MQKRELWKVIVFGLITFGIYDLFWLYKTHKELKAKGQALPSIWLLIAPYILLFALTILLFIVLIAASAGNATDSTAGAVSILFILPIILVSLAAIPIALYWFYMYCKAVEVVTKGKLGLALNYIMFLVLNIIGFGFLWPALVQDAYNKTS